MSSQTERPYAWVRQIPGNIFALDEKPLLGFHPAFDWNAMSKQIQDNLQLTTFSIHPGEWMWRSTEDLFTGLGKEVKGLPLTITPLAGIAFWVMPRQEISKLMTLLLAAQPSSSNTDIDDDFFRTFYRFIAVEAMGAYQHVNLDKELSPTLSGDTSLPSEDSLCLDIHFHVNGEPFFGRLFLSKELKSAWRQRNISQQPNNALGSPIADSLDVIVHLEAGRVNLSLNEWKKVRTGDFLFLDTCSLDPDEDKGRVMLTINGTPYFRARIKGGSLKILEHPLYHEADTIMDDSKNHDEEESDIFSDSDLNFDTEENSKTDADGETSTDLDLTDSDLDFTDDDLDLSDASLADNTKEAPAAKEKTLSDATISEGEISEEVHVKSNGSTPASLEEIPLPVVIELGRIQISIKKLLELQPGNMLDLNIHPESGVDLIVNGKRIARGELLRIGESLGVRIQELS